MAVTDYIAYFADLFAKLVKLIQDFLGNFSK